MDFSGEGSDLNGNCVTLAGFICYITKSYDEGLTIVEGLKLSGEALAELTRVYNLSITRIESLPPQDLISELSVERNEQGNIIIPSETQAIWVHNLFLGKSIFSEIRYKSPNLIEDTEIEEKWTSYARKQTGIPLGSLY